LRRSRHQFYLHLTHCSAASPSVFWVKGSPGWINLAQMD
jgi:hypothetical protein